MYRDAIEPEVIAFFESLDCEGPRDCTKASGVPLGVEGLLVPDVATRVEGVTRPEPF
jgi:hypothetical protein